MNRLRKALLASAFLFSALPLAATGQQAGDCPPPYNAQQHRLQQVYDGDTLALRDGRKVRLIGINTPEFGRDGRPDEPLAHRAQTRLRQLLSNQSLLLVVGHERQDRYGRLLAHVYTDQGHSVEALLLREGLGFQISIPPNTALHDCLQRAEASARLQRLGVWSEPYFQPREVTQLSTTAGGFGRYRGRVTQVGHNRSGPFLELDNQLYLPISRASQPLFDQAGLKQLLGQRVEVRGWLSYRALTPDQRARNWRPFRLYLSHPDALTPLGTPRAQPD